MCRLYIVVFIGLKVSFIYSCYYWF